MEKPSARPFPPSFRSISDPIHQKSLRGQRVLVRVDFNVPLGVDSTTGKRRPSDLTRVKSAIETIKLLQSLDCQVMLISHLGRPDPDDQATWAKNSLEPVAPALEKLLGGRTRVVFSCETVGESVESVLSQTASDPSQVILLENLRFHAGEKDNDPAFAKQLAKLADCYVNEAFSVSHRADASVVGLADLLPSYAGLNLEKEVRALTKLTDSPTRPFVMIIGGAKISDKVAAVQHLAELADAVIVGGGTANNFLKAEGIEIHESYLEEPTAIGKGKKKVNFVKVAQELLEDTRSDKIIIDGYIPLPKINLPIDAVAAPGLESKADQCETVELTSSQVITSRDDVMFLDIGPKSIQIFKEIIEEAGTIFWNGPLGVFEREPFATGTREIATAIADSQAYSVIGGGDTLAAAQAFGLIDQFDHVSVAGGAALDLLAGKKLPGLKALSKSKSKPKSK